MEKNRAAALRLTAIPTAARPTLTQYKESAAHHADAFVGEQERTEDAARDAQHEDDDWSAQTAMDSPHGSMRADLP